jgi:hypothetical protein
MIVKALDAARIQHAVYAALADEHSYRLHEAKALHAREADRLGYLKSVTWAKAVELEVSKALVDARAASVETIRAAHDKAADERDLWDRVVQDFEGQLAE